MCNNYSYVIMLSAAFDLLKEDHPVAQHQNKTGNATTGNATTAFCNPISTGAVLLADIVPSLAVKMIAPFLPLGVHIRVFVAVVLSAVSFIVTSISTAHWITFFGVVCASLSSGLGEVTFLSFSSYFEKNVVSAWSSGTGGAGFIGALSYASLTHILSVPKSLQVMLVIPSLMALTFWLIIDHPPATKVKWNFVSCSSELDPMLPDSVDLGIKYKRKQKKYTFNEKINLIKPLLKYMIPLGVVYFAEYFINQGLMELLYFENASEWLSHPSQYRWYQVDYQLGVLLSRSSVNLFQIKRLWILPILQVMNMVLILIEAYHEFMNSIFIMFAIIFYEGLLGGSAYVNTFYKIVQEVPEEDKEFSMGIASLGDSTGIAFAGAVALPVHDALCKMHLPH